VVGYDFYQGSQQHPHSVGLVLRVGHRHLVASSLLLVVAYAARASARMRRSRCRAVSAIPTIL
jgi:hypothetical protein